MANIDNVDTYVVACYTIFPCYRCDIRLYRAYYCQEMEFIYAVAKSLSFVKLIMRRDKLLIGPYRLNKFNEVNGRSNRHTQRLQLTILIGTTDDVSRLKDIDNVTVSTTVTQTVGIDRSKVLDTPDFKVS